MRDNILVVEDDTDINNLLREILEQNGYAVTQAYSGTEAKLISKAQQHLKRCRAQIKALYPTFTYILREVVISTEEAINFSKVLQGTLMGRLGVNK